MKKALCLLLICIAFCLCAAGCEKKQSGKGDEQINNGEIIEQINTALKALPAQFSLEAETTYGGAVLHAGCEVQKESYYDDSEKLLITYTFEQLNTIVRNSDGSYSIPSSYVSTYTGSITVQNGTVVEMDGAKIDLPIQILTVQGLVFSMDYLENIQMENNTFCADVTSPTGFFGSELSAKNMKVQVTLQENAIQGMQITYTTEENADISVVYTIK